MSRTKAVKPKTTKPKLKKVKVERAIKPDETAGDFVAEVIKERSTTIDFNNLPLTYRGANKKNIERILEVIESNDIVECDKETNPAMLLEYIHDKYPDLKVRIIPFSQY